MLQAFVLILGLLCALPALARDPRACSSPVLRADQRWNPADAYVSDELSRFYSTHDLLDNAMRAGDATKTRLFAHEYLALANRFFCNWNYGNAIHDGNSALGILALESGDLTAARAYLLAAGRSPGSPQLDTFGPSLELAREMLKRREFTVVQTYFESVATFWSMDDGLLQKWISQLRQGQAPDIARYCRKNS